MIYLMIPLTIYFIFQLRELARKNKHLDSAGINGMISKEPKLPFGLIVLYVSIIVFIVSVPIMILSDLREKLIINGKTHYILLGSVFVIYFPIVLAFISLKEKENKDYHV